MNAGSPVSHAPGALLLVPNTLDLGSAAPPPIQSQLPQAVIERAAGLGHWVVEDARSARAFLKRVAAVVPLAQALQATRIDEMPRGRKGSAEPVPATAWSALLAPALAGHDIGVLSEAGLPGVADPGAALVQAAHEAGLVVEPLPGASSLLLALAASGLNGQSFAFVGYVPQDPAARAARIGELEALSRRQRQTQLLIEAPYRNAALLAALLQTLSPASRLAVSCGLTLPSAWTRSDRIAAWRSNPETRALDEPAVFSLLA
jgi:16S rRNA (cytidine1402-2'-O)-methyltransferase